MTSLEESLRETAARVDVRLPELVGQLCEPGTLQNAINYSLTAGGKRLRPWLCIHTAAMFGNADDALDFACAIEMIHTYSLIHDDLPAMDDDVLRRGRPTNHMVFGEAVAILAGDALLNGAVEVMTRYALEHPRLNGLLAMDIMARAAGAAGMIAGQVGDIEFECKDKDEVTLYYIHERKTAAMIRGAVLSGAALLDAGEADMQALRSYGDSIGLVFQIVDDILDVTSDAATLGKTPGKDAEAGKQTFATVYGLEKARVIAAQQTQSATDALKRFSTRADALRGMAQYLLGRDR
jgi:geranylgeranyl diphosphate synthase, type II